MNMQQNTADPVKRPFYGWFALAGVMLIVFTVGGVFSNTFGVFLPVICDHFGWSRGSISLALSIGLMAFGLPSPIFGIVVARLGPRMTIILGNLLAVIGIASLSLVREIWHFYALYVFIGFTAGFGGYVACTSVITNWFIKKRPIALGLFTAFSGLGGFVFPPLATWLIDYLGWRMSYVTLASITGLLGVFIGGVLLTRNNPSEKKQMPDGMLPDLYTDIKKAETLTPATSRPVSSILLGLLKSPVIWFCAIFAAIAAFAAGVITTHQVSYMLDIGYSAISAATTISLFAAMSFIGSLSFGTMAMKINIRVLITAGFGVMLLAVILLLVSKDITLLYLYAMLLGLGVGAISTAMPTFISGYYHGPMYSQAFGIIVPFQIVSQSFAAFIAGIIYDITSSYTTAFYIVAGLIALGVILVGFTRIPRSSRS